MTGTVLSVDPTCPVELGSLTDEDCLRPNPLDILNITTILWAGTLGGILAIASMIMIMHGYCRNVGTIFAANKDIEYFKVSVYKEKN